MLRLGLIDPEAMVRYHESVSSQLHRYPSIDEKSLGAAVEHLFGGGRDPAEAHGGA